MRINPAKATRLTTVAAARALLAATAGGGDTRSECTVRTLTGPGPIQFDAATALSNQTLRKIA